MTNDSQQRIVAADGRRRVTLGGAIEPGQLYSVTVADDGVITLTPVVAVPKSQVANRNRLRAA